MSASTTLQAQSELAHRLALSRALKEITTSCRLATRELGFRFFLLLVRLPGSLDVPLQVVISGVPQEWDRLYDHYQWADIDPVLRRAITSTVPFAADEVDWCADARVQAMRSAMRMHGLEEGLTVPLHGPAAEKGLITFYGAEVSHATARELNEVMSLAQLYAHRIYDALIESVRATIERDRDDGALTPRERQVLSLAARGDRAKVIAWKLKITPRTVTYFLRRAAQKIGAASIREAICQAALRGQLDLVEYPNQLRSSTAFLKDESTRELLSASNVVRGSFIREPACEI